MTQPTRTASTSLSSSGEEFTSGQLSGTRAVEIHDEALNRLSQAEQRIRVQHPKAAHDPQLVAILSTLRDNPENR